MKKILLFLFFLLIACSGMAQQTIKVLSVGNSFSRDALLYDLHKIARADGVTLVIGVAYYGGACLSNHVTFIQENQSLLTYYKIDETGKLSLEENQNLSSIIADEDWDYFSFQQCSSFSGVSDTYSPYLLQLVNYVRRRATNPNHRYVFHQTWAYAAGSKQYGFKEFYGSDQLTMYNAIVGAAKEINKTVAFDMNVPVGTAVQNARSSRLGDRFCVDGVHLNSLGYYVAACVWAAKLTGKDIRDNTYSPPDINEADAKLLRYAASYAVSRPERVTSMVGYTGLEQPELNLRLRKETDRTYSLELPDGYVSFIISIYNLSGVLIDRVSCSDNTCSFSLSLPGFYSVQIASGDQVITLKLVVD